MHRGEIPAGAIRYATRHLLAPELEKCLQVNENQHLPELFFRRRLILWRHSLIRSAERQILLTVASIGERIDAVFVVNRARPDRQTTNVADALPQPLAIAP